MARLMKLYLKWVKSNGKKIASGLFMHFLALQVYSFPRTLSGCGTSFLILLLL
jgi:hypothetical protein